MPSELMTAKFFKIPWLLLILKSMELRNVNFITENQCLNKIIPEMKEITRCHRSTLTNL
jgi:hypothetical protein